MRQYGRTFWGGYEQTGFSRTGKQLNTTDPLMQITLQVEQALAVALQSPDKRLQNARRVYDLLRQAHASLEPMHPGTQNIELRRY